MAIRCSKVAACYKEETENQEDEDYNKSQVGGNDCDQESENEYSPHYTHSVSKVSALILRAKPYIS